MAHAAVEWTGSVELGVVQADVAAESFSCGLDAHLSNAGAAPKTLKPPRRGDPIHARLPAVYIISPAPAAPIATNVVP